MPDSHNLIKILNAPRRTVTLERIEEMLLFAAKLVDERGEVMRPILDRLEREYLAATRRRSETDRVRELIRRRTAIRGRLE
ncbi:MAG: hypothetical protein H2044_01510 [Rhizobiales bacterium]|nr:hypothetical protein [Hyphomicrobiales bacterium]